MLLSAEPAPKTMPSRGELTFIVVLTLVAFGLRAAALSRVSVEHFDEAIYASNLLFGEAEGYAYPGRDFFAPPLFPFLVEWTMIFTGVNGTSAMYVNVFFGTLMIPLLWYVGRTWFDPIAGGVTAMVAAGYDFHIFYSRTALTDVSLCVWWLLAVWAYERSFSLRSWKCAIVAGIFSGLAWATKYNGWITWLIASTGGLGYVLFALGEQPLARRLKLWITTCGLGLAVMLACWYPVWSGLQDSGGYAAVAENHRGYFVGFGGWMNSAGIQVDHQRAFHGFLTVFCLSLPYISLLLAAREYRRAFHVKRSAEVPRSSLPNFNGFVIFTTLLTLILLGQIAGLGLLVVMGTAIYLVDLLLTSMGWTARRLRFFSAVPGHFSHSGLWLLGSWLLGMLLATPLYQPYPRLVLPLLEASWLGYGMLVSSVLAEVRHHSAERDRSNPFEVSRGVVFWSIAAGFLVAGGMSLLNRSSLGVFPAWQTRMGMARISQNLVETVSRETLGRRNDAVIYVWGEPAVVFHLRSAGWAAVPVADWGFLEPVSGSTAVPRFFVTGPHFAQSPDGSAEFPRYAESLDLVESFAYQPSALVALEKQPPSEQPAVWVYRVTP